MKKLHHLSLALAVLGCTDPMVLAQETSSFWDGFVEITGPAQHFHISKYAVTEQEYNNFLEGTYPRVPEKTVLSETEKNLPVLVNHDQAGYYLNYLTNLYQCPLRLPTEVEWQLAAVGSPVPLMGKERRCAACTLPNANGVYGMMGNTWEWTSTADPLDSDTYFVIKGGDYQEPREGLDPTSRFVVNKEMGDMVIGFRIVVSHHNYLKGRDMEEAEALLEILVPDKSVSLTPWALWVDGMELHHFSEANEAAKMRIFPKEHEFTLCCVEAFDPDTDTSTQNAISFAYTPESEPKLYRLQELLERILKDEYED